MQNRKLKHIAITLGALLLLTGFQNCGRALPPAANKRSVSDSPENQPSDTGGDAERTPLPVPVPAPAPLPIPAPGPFPAPAPAPPAGQPPGGSDSGAVYQSLHQAHVKSSVDGYLNVTGLAKASNPGIIVPGIFTDESAIIYSACAWVGVAEYRSRCDTPLNRFPLKIAVVTPGNPYLYSPPNGKYKIFLPPGTLSFRIVEECPEGPDTRCESKTAIRFRTPPTGTSTLPDVLLEVAIPGHSAELGDSSKFLDQVDKGATFYSKTRGGGIQVANGDSYLSTPLKTGGWLYFNRYDGYKTSYGSGNSNLDDRVIFRINNRTNVDKKTYVEWFKCMVKYNLFDQNGDPKEPYVDPPMKADPNPDTPGGLLCN